MTAPLLLPGLDTSPPLADINGSEEATQKHTYGRAEDEQTTKKTHDTHDGTGSSSKRALPTSPFLNYAEGSIVCFRLRLRLLQIIERFKDVVGGGSCGLSCFFCFFSPCLFSTFPSPLVSRSRLAFGAHLSFYVPSLYATLCTVPLVTEQ